MVAVQAEQFLPIHLLTGDTEDGAARPKTPQHMEVFYRRRMEKMASDREEISAKLSESAAKAQKTARRLKNETILMQKEINQLREEAVEQEEHMQVLRDENCEVHALRVRCAEQERIHEQDSVFAGQQATQLKETSREYFSEAIERHAQLLDWQRKRADALEAENKTSKERLAQLEASASQDAEQHQELNEAHVLLQAEYKEASTKLHALQHTTTIQDLEAAEGRVVALENEREGLRKENQTLHEKLDQALSARAQKNRQLQSYRRLSSMPARPIDCQGGLATDPAGKSNTLLKFSTAAKAALVSVSSHSHEAVIDEADPDEFVVMLTEQAADLEQEVAQLKQLHKVLSQANIGLSDDCIARSASMVELQRQLTLSEELLVPYTISVQELKQSALKQQARIEGLDATVAREVRIRRQLARIGELTYRALGSLEGGIVAASSPRPGGLAEAAVLARQTMEAAAPLGPHKGAPLATQLQLLADLAADDLLPLETSSKDSSSLQKADTTFLRNADATLLSLARTAQRLIVPKEGSPRAHRGARRPRPELPQTVSLYADVMMTVEGIASPRNPAPPREVTSVSLPSLEVRSAPNTAPVTVPASGPAYHSAKALHVASSLNRPSPARRQLRYPTGSMDGQPCEINTRLAIAEQP